MTAAAAQRPLGGTGLAVGPLCIGTSPLASMARLHGYEVSEERAVETVEAVFDSAIDFIDTSNGYGEDGTAERRIDSTVVGVSRPERVAETVRAAELPIPGELSAALDRLVPAADTWLDA